MRRLTFLLNGAESSSSKVKLASSFTSSYDILITKSNPKYGEGGLTMPFVARVFQECNTFCSPASQQLEIRMLREQVEKLSVMVQRMDRQRKSSVASSTEELRIEPSRRAGSLARRSGS